MQDAVGDVCQAAAPRKPEPKIVIFHQSFGPVVAGGKHHAPAEQRRRAADSRVLDHKVDNVVVMQVRLVRAHRLAAGGINHIIAAADHRHVRVCFQKRHLFRQPVRGVDVVGMDNGAQLRFRQHRHVR